MSTKKSLAVQILDLYRVERGAMVEVARKVGCSREYVRLVWKAAGLQTTPPKKVKPILTKAVRRKHGRETGWFEDEYVEAVKAQGNSCAICAGPPGRRGLHADHDHKTGRKRALLCTRCNMMLGYALDKPEVLRAGAQYMEQYQ